MSLTLPESVIDSLLIFFFCFYSTRSNRYALRKENLSSSVRFFFQILLLFIYINIRVVFRWLSLSNEAGVVLR